MTMTTIPTRDADVVVDGFDLPDGLTAWLIASEDYHQDDAPRGMADAGHRIPKRPTMRVVISRLLTDDGDVVDWLERFATVEASSFLTRYLVMNYGADPNKAERMLTCLRSAAVYHHARHQSHPTELDTAALAWRTLYLRIAEALRNGEMTEHEASSNAILVNGAKLHTERMIPALRDVTTRERHRWDDLSYPWHETEDIDGWWN